MECETKSKRRPELSQFRFYRGILFFFLSIFSTRIPHSFSIVVVAVDMKMRLSVLTIWQFNFLLISGFNGLDLDTIVILTCFDHFSFQFSSDFCLSQLDFSSDLLCYVMTNIQFLLKCF